MTRKGIDRTSLAFLHVEVVDDDADEEVEGEEGAEDDEEDEVKVHGPARLAIGLLVSLKQPHPSAPITASLNQSWR